MKETLLVMMRQRCIKRQLSGDAWDVVKGWGNKLSDRFSEKKEENTSKPQSEEPKIDVQITTEPDPTPTPKASSSNDSIPSGLEEVDRELTIKPEIEKMFGVVTSEQLMHVGKGLALAGIVIGSVTYILYKNGSLECIVNDAKKHPYIYSAATTFAVLGLIATLAKTA